MQFDPTSAKLEETTSTPALAFDPTSATLYEPKVGDPFARTREMIAGPVGAFAQSVGRGATMGLTDYPAAAALMGVRALTGGAPLSYREALGEVQRQQRATSKEYPTATTLGALTGTLTPTAALPGMAITAGKVTAPVVRGAVGGGVAGATSTDVAQSDNLMRDYLKNIGIGSLTGAGLGATFGTLGAIPGYLSKKSTERFEAAVRPAAERAVEQQIAAGIIPANISSQIKEKFVQNIIERSKKAVPLSELASLAGNRLYEEVKSAVRPALTGAALGAGLGAITSGDPLSGALVGSGSFIAAAKLRAAQLADPVLRDAMMKYAMQPRDPLRQATEALAAPLTYGLTPEFTKFYQSPPAAPVDRLSQLADEFKNRMGGNQ